MIKANETKAPDFQKKSAVVILGFIISLSETDRSLKNRKTLSANQTWLVFIKYPQTVECGVISSVTKIHKGSPYAGL